MFETIGLVFAEQSKSALRQLQEPFKTAYLNSWNRRCVNLVCTSTIYYPSENNTNQRMTLIAWFVNFHMTYIKVRLSIRGSNDGKPYSELISYWDISTLEHFTKQPSWFHMKRYYQSFIRNHWRKITIFHQCWKLVKNEADDFLFFSRTIDRECEHFKWRSVTVQTFRISAIYYPLGHWLWSLGCFRFLKMISPSMENLAAFLSTMIQAIINSDSLRILKAPINASGKPPTANLDKCHFG